MSAVALIAGPRDTSTEHSCVNLNIFKFIIHCDESIMIFELVHTCTHHITNYATHRRSALHAQWRISILNTEKADKILESQNEIMIK